MNLVISFTIFYLSVWREINAFRSHIGSYEFSQSVLYFTNSMLNFLQGFAKNWYHRYFSWISICSLIDSSSLTKNIQSLDEDGIRQFHRWVVWNKRFSFVEVSKIYRSHVVWVAWNFRLFNFWYETFLLLFRKSSRDNFRLEYILQEIFLVRNELPMILNLGEQVHFDRWDKSVAHQNHLCMHLFLRPYNQHKKRQNHWYAPSYILHRRCIQHEEKYSLWKLWILGYQGLQIV